MTFSSRSTLAARTSSPVATKRRGLLWAVEVAYVAVILVVTGLRALIGTDILGDDESAYLSRGLAIHSGVMPAFTDGAGYSALYFFGSFLFPDPIDLYFAGRVAVAVVFVLSIWLTTRLFTSPSPAILAAMLAAMTPATYVWPGVSGPAIGVALIAVGLAIRFPGPLSLGVTSGLLWVAGSMRPEFVYAALFSSVVPVVVLVNIVITKSRASGTPGNVVAVAGGAIAVPVWLIATFGSPFSDSGRSWVAFGQHFARRNTLEGEYHWTDWGQVVERSFPGASSVLDAVVVNPLAVIGHVFFNAAWAPLALGRSLVGYPGVDGPTVLFSWIAIGVVSLFLAIGLVTKRRSFRKLSTSITNAVTTRLSRPWWWIALVVFGLSLVSVLVVFPRTHYMILWAGAYLIALGIIFHRLPAKLLWRRVSGIAVGATFFAFAVYSASLFFEEPPVRERPAAAALIEIRALDKDMVVLGRTREMQVYTESTWETATDTPAGDETLQSFLDRVEATIVFAEDPGASAPWTLLPEWDLFQATPEVYGFSGSIDAGFYWR